MCELASELRIGNWYSFADYHGIAYRQVRQIKENEFGLLSDYDGVNFEICKPIPLTEEWLVKFVLNEYNDIKVKDNGFICIERVNSEIKLYILGHDNPAYSSMFSIKLDYVHQLQNLYFALTGIELTHQKIN